MSVQVNLQEIVDEMDMDSYDLLRLIDTTTGKLVFLLREFLTYAEDGEPRDDMPEWQQEEMIRATDVLEHEDKYISLPSKFDINEYGMMEDFCFMQAGSKQTELLNAINGKGAFRRFEDKIHELNLEDVWYAFRDESYKEIAIDFCKLHGLEYK